MSLRALTRRLGRGSLSGFWQGRYTLQPWNEVANSHAYPPESQGPIWDSNGDYGFAAFSNVTNPSIGLDSVYQKHVYSRLAPLEAPEGSGDHKDGQGEAIAAAAVFATLQPAAAAAAQKNANIEDDLPHTKQSGDGVSAGIETDLNADSIALAVESALGPSMTEEPDTAEAAAAVPYVSTIRDPHIDQNALKITAAKSKAGAPAVAEPHRCEPAEAISAPPAADGSGSQGQVPAHAQASLHPEISKDVPTPGASAQIQEAADPEPSSMGAAAALAALPSRPVREPDLMLGMMWALPEEARDGTASASKSTAVVAASRINATADNCRDKEALLARSLADVASKKVRQSSAPSTASKKVEGAEGHAPRHNNSGAGTAATRPVQPPTRRQGVTQAVAHVMPAAQAPIVAAPEAGNQAVPVHLPPASSSKVASKGRSATLDPRDSAAERDAGRQHCIKPGTFDDDRFLWDSRWRLSQLLDKDSMKAVHDASAGRGVLAVQGSVCGCPVSAFCLDAAALEDSASAHSACCHISHLLDRAVLAGHPVVGIYSGSASLRPAQASASQHWADLVLRQMDASGVIPQLSVILGPPASSDSIALLLSTADFAFTVQPEQQAEPEQAEPLTSFTSPGDCSRSQGRNESAGMSQHEMLAGHNETGEVAGVSHHEVIGQLCESSKALAATGAGRLAAFLHAFLHQSLGLVAALVAALQRAMRPVQAACEPALLTVPDPASMMTGGQLAKACGNEREALQRARELLMYLPASNRCRSPKVDCMDPEWRTSPALDAMAAQLCRGVPINAGTLVRNIVDGGNVCSIAPEGVVSPSLLGFARMGSTAVGILALSSVLRGVVDPLHSSMASKAARLVRFCDAFNMPVVTLLLPPLPISRNQKSGPDPQANGARALANLIFAFSEATVPKLTVVVGSDVSQTLSQCLRSDVMLAWSVPGVPLSTGGPIRIITPSNTRAVLCAELAALLQPRVVVRPRRKHALLPH
ncbi:probable propionyl-CoA carboxylase beta chain, mitochondrial at C-terminar half [Coccomyxa sp. Obi]|nr:probable propionyl-CoA carboxylase beta chain, mitochondrial at C-terminar half [Coccomyxa sp. Obi]